MTIAGWSRPARRRRTGATGSTAMGGSKQADSDAAWLLTLRPTMTTSAPPVTASVQFIAYS
ncbi:MAG: hypothetical protein VXZ39_04920 [Planctomycetota bacterium]|nr:hypothetical protein [Planctomycetota bacterium]